MNEMLEDFLSRGIFTDATRETYQYHLERFLEWVSPADLATVGEKTIRRYLAAQKTWGTTTRYSSVAAIKSFFKTMYGSSHPALSLKVEHPDPAPQRTLDADQLEELMRSFDGYTPEGIRNLAIVCLMADTGLRASEVCKLDMRYLDMHLKIIKVRCKGKAGAGNWEVAAFFDYAADCIRAWLGIRSRYARPGVHTVFVSVNGKTKGCPLTTGGLRANFRRMGWRAGLDAFSPHDLRRTMATQAIENGAPTRIVQVAGRWRSLGMLERYTRALTARQMQPYSPVNHAMEYRESNPEPAKKNRA